MLIGTFARHTDQIKSALAHSPDFIDLRMDLNHSINFSEAQKLLSEAGVGCTLHLPSHPDWTPMDLPLELIPYIDKGAEIDAAIVTFHSALSTLFYSDQEIDNFLRNITLACDAANEAGIQLAIETLGLFYTELALLFERCPKTKIALDIGHGQILAHWNRAFDIITSSYDRISMVNIHDNHGSKMVDDLLALRKKREVSSQEIREMARQHDTHLPIGEGCIDFEPIFRELKERSYDDRFLMMCKDPSRFPSERDKFAEFWLRA